MNSDASEATLFEALNGLESTFRELSRQAQHIYEPRLERFQKVIASLGLTTTARPPRDTDEYLRDWQRYLDDPRQGLKQRAVRYLCWEPEVAITSNFQDCLDRDTGEPSTRMLQGLVRSCHMRWSLAFAAGPVAHRMKRRLEMYRRPHRVLARWREHSEMLLGSPRGTISLLTPWLQLVCLSRDIVKHGRWTKSRYMFSKRYAMLCIRATSTWGMRRHGEAVSSRRSCHGEDGPCRLFVRL